MQHPFWGDVSYPLPMPKAWLFQRSAALPRQPFESGAITRFPATLGQTWRRGSAAKGKAGLLAMRHRFWATLAPCWRGSPSTERLSVFAART